MFAHNGFIYFSIGIAISVLVTIFAIPSSKNQKYISAFTFIGISFLMATLYYFLEANINGTYNFVELFYLIADNSYFGTFNLKNIDLLGTIESNLWSGVNWFTNFEENAIYKYWAPDLEKIEFNLATKSLRIFQLGLMIATIFSIIYYGFKHSFSPIKYLFIPGLIISFIYFIGFSLRQTGSHYYTLTIVPNIFIFSSIVFSPKISTIEYRIYSVLLTLLIIANYSYNTFSKFSVFEGSNINDHPYYSENIIIHKSVAKQDAVYFRDIDISYYPNFAMSQYYESKFGNINWISQQGNWDTKEELLHQIITYTNKEQQVLIGIKAYNLISETDTLEFVKINNQILKVNY